MPRRRGPFVVVDVQGEGGQGGVRNVTVARRIGTDDALPDAGGRPVAPSAVQRRVVDRRARRGIRVVIVVDVIFVVVDVVVFPRPSYSVARVRRRGYI